MSVAGFRVNLKESGTPTASTGNTFNADGTTVTNRYQISSTAKRVFDRTVEPSGFKTTGGTTVSSTEISTVDYLFGKVTFNSTQGSAVTGDVTHLPLSNVAGANSFTLDMNTDLLDDTDFTSTGFRSRNPALKDVSLSVTRWDSLDMEWFKRLNSTSINSSAASTGSNQVVVEVNFDTNSTADDIGRGYFRVESENRSGDVAALESAELSLSLDGDTKAAWQFSKLA